MFRSAVLLTVSISKMWSGVVVPIPTPVSVIRTLSALPVAKRISVARIPNAVFALPAVFTAWNPATLPISPIFP